MLNPKEMNECPVKEHNLKKQSQFAGWQNDVKLVITMVYGDFDR
jgi:hypothetical protein